MKQEELCKAFCDDLIVRTVPAGLAVSTAFVGSDGDRIGFYVREQSPNVFRLEDDGITLPMLEASGLDFSSGTRGAAMQELLSEYGVLIDEEARQFAMVGVEESTLPKMALSFVAFSLRVRDFILMTEARVVGTFREDVARLLKQAINGRAEIEEKVPVLPELSDFNARLCSARSEPAASRYLPWYLGCPGAGGHLGSDEGAVRDKCPMLDYRPTGEKPQRYLRSSSERVQPAFHRASLSWG